MTILRETSHSAPQSAYDTSYIPNAERQSALRPMSMINEQRLAVRQVLFKEGDAAGTVFEILEGSVILSKHLPGGRRQVTDLLNAGDFFGLVSGETYDCTATALCETRVKRIERSKAEVSERIQGEVKARLIEKIEEMREHALLLGRKTALERIATLLSKQFSGGRTKGQALSRLDGRRPSEATLSQTEMADYLGLTVETVSRTLTRLKKDGIIAVSGKGQLRILDGARLEALSLSEGAKPAAA